MTIKTTVKLFITASLFSAATQSILNNPVYADTIEHRKGIHKTAPEVTNEERNMSFWDLPYLENAYIGTAPEKRKDGLAVGQLKNKKGKKAIVALAKEIQAGKHGDYDSMLISYQGKLLFESYFRRARVNLAGDQASAAKAYTSLALGRAIQLGYLTMEDLNKPLVGFLKQLDKSQLVDGAEKITLHKALTMRGGIRINEETRKSLEKTPNKLKGQSHVQALLKHSSPITKASQEYAYGNFNPTLVMQVIDAVVPGTAEAFIKRELLDKLGIANYTWQNAVSGLPEAGWRVSMTSRDMLKWGALFTNNGKWQGEQLISPAYLTKATSGILKPTEDWMPDNYMYGYFVYQTEVKVGDHTYLANFAWGGGGQYIISVAELDLVVVIKGHDREDKIMSQVIETVIPAFVS